VNGLHHEKKLTKKREGKKVGRKEKKRIPRRVTKEFKSWASVGFGLLGSLGKVEIQRSTTVGSKKRVGRKADAKHEGGLHDLGPQSMAGKGPFQVVRGGTFPYLKRVI